MFEPRSVCDNKVSCTRSAAMHGAGHWWVAVEFEISNVAAMEAIYNFSVFAQFQLENITQLHNSLYFRYSSPDSPSMNKSYEISITWYVFIERELTFAICYRASVCCLSVVCNVRAPYSAGWNFRQSCYVIWYLAIRWHSRKILRRSSQEDPSVGELNTREVANYSDFVPIEGYISETVQDRRKVSINH